MASDAWVAELLDMPPDEPLSHLRRYLTERYLREDRPTAVNAFVAGLWSLLADDETPEMPRLMGLSEFLDSIGEPPPAMVEGFLPANKLICMSGNAKEGKSLVVMQILADICRGGKMLGRFDVVTSGPVVYFEMEGGPFELKERLTLRGNIDDEGYYVCAVPLDMHGDVGWGTYLSLIEELPAPPSLVVIDTAREAFGSIKDWNDAALVGPALKRIRNWSHKHCTVILICHNNKDKFASGVNRVSGSSALVSSTDVVAILTNQKVLETGDLRWDYEIGGRGVKKASYKLQMDTHTLHVRCLDDDEASKAATEDSIKGRVAMKRQFLEYSKPLEFFTPMTVANAFEVSAQYARELLNEMAREGVLKKGMKIKNEDGRSQSQSYVFEKDYDCDLPNNDDETLTVAEKTVSSSSEPPEFLRTFFDGTAESVHPPEPKPDEEWKSE